ncbi:MAG: nuclear transport factor 2 family protein [Ilumatobacteraceae bacterium]
MSHLPTVQALYEAFGAGDVPTFLGHLAEDVEWEQWPDNRAVEAGVPWLQHHSGREAVGGFFAAAAQMEIVDLQILNMMEGGNEVAVSFVLEAKLPNCGGRSYRDEEIHLWTFNDDGKVSRLRHYVDTAKHIAAYRG